ncbi:MAG TPA: serine hydrolase [Chitinophagaceae bacterium]|nr:serine hydrolase [Chitinophagaceae bacterium]
MKKLIISFAFALLMQEARLEAQVTSPTFDPVWAAKFQDAINNGLPGSGVHGVSVALTFPGMGTFIGVAGESAPGIPMTPDMQFGIGSNTKLFTSVLALKLQELGILSLDDRLSDWLPAYANIDGAATIRQCLLHETGFFDYSADIDPTDAALVNEPQHVYTQQEALQRVGPPHFEVGREMRYSHTNYNLVGLAMEAASGKTYTELLHQYIFDPLHLDNTFLAVYESPNGNVAHGWYFGNDIGTTPLASPYSIYWSSGAIYSTANEMVQWYDNLFAGNIINQASLKELTYFDKTTFYASGFWYRSYPTLPDDEVDAEGNDVPGYSSQVGYDVKRRASFCFLTNEGGAQGPQIFSFLFPVLTEFYLGYTRRSDDAGIAKVLSPSSQKCDGTFSPEVLLQNFGSANLQSVVINYQVDNGLINSYNWTGNLVTDATVTLTLPAVTVPGGNHSFKAFTSNPNGNTEGYDYNDAASSKFTINNGPFPTSIDEGFEGEEFPAGWQNGNNTIYDWGVSNVGYFANGSNKGIGRNNFDDGTNRSYELELPYLNLSPDHNPVLSFDYSYAFNLDCPQCIDELEVLVSKNCGNTYQSVFTRKGQALKIANANTFHYPKSNDWGTRTIDLSTYKTNVLIKFRMNSGGGNLFYLDNIKVADVSAVCQTPTDLNELQVTNSSAKLTWKFRGTSNHFDVYYRPKNSIDWNLKTIAGNKDFADVSGLVPGTDYEWYITAACKSANSTASPRSFFTTDSELSGITSSSIVSPEIPVLQNQLKIFPNPTSGRAIISFTTPKAGKVSLTIYDITGRLVKTIANTELDKGDHTLNVDVKSFGVGIYLLRMQSAGILQTRKFIVVK